METYSYVCVLIYNLIIMKKFMCCAIFSKVFIFPMVITISIHHNLRIWHTHTHTHTHYQNFVTVVV